MHLINYFNIHYYLLDKNRFSVMKKPKQPAVQPRNFSAWPKRELRKTAAAAARGGERRPPAHTASSDNISPKVAFLAYN